MLELGPQHSLSYRKELLAPLFSRIRSAESCAVVGAASMGKTRLLDFIMRPDVQQNYLGELADQTLFVRVDCNLMYQSNMWGFYELLMMSLAEACGQQTESSLMRPQINNLQAQVIATENALMALRFFQLVVFQLCNEKNFRLCFLLDEFDKPYRELDEQVFAHLRAVRDANKNRLCYMLFLRSMPQHLRDPQVCEGFYELFSRSMIGLTPYTNQDLSVVLEQYEVRLQQPFSPQTKARMLSLSGGHPGLLRAIFDIAGEQTGNPACLEDTGWLAGQPRVAEECRKLWEGLTQPERLGLIQVARQVEVQPDVLDALKLRGLVQARGGRDEIFTPLLAVYVLKVEPELSRVLRVDSANHTVHIGSRQIHDLSNLEFKLLEYLYARLGHVCRRDEIMQAIYGDPGEGPQDSRLDRLVNRLREAIEPDQNNPRFLFTVRGVGFRLEG